MSVAPGQEVGAAYVTLLPSARGFGKAVEGEIDSGTQNAEKKATKGFAGMAKTVGKFAAGALVTVGGIITGLALKGGISRALNIEDAQAKLKGLGHDAGSVEKIMTNALASVKGTAFGLDSAATIAASAVAAGIKPGKELEKYLKLTADAATIAGVSLDEMGAILNKTTSSGKVFTDNLNQLSDRGIPIFQWLAEEYGVTQAELSKMVAAGEVDAETFRKVIEENIGGAALASGETTRGAWANMLAGLSRLGVTLTSAVMPHMKGLFGELTTIIDGLNDRIGPFAERFAEWFNDKIGPAIEGMGGRFLDFIDGLSSGGSGLGGLFTLLNPIGALLKAMTPLWGPLGDAVMQVGEALGSALVPIVEVLGAALFVLVKTGIEPLVPLLGDFLVTALGLVAPLLTGLVPIITALLTGLLPVVPVLVQLAQTLFPMLATVVGELMGALAPLLPVVGALVTALMPVLAEILTTVVSAVTPLIPAVLSLVKALTPIIAVVGQLVARLLPPLLDLFVGLLEPVLKLLEPLVGALAPVLEVIADLLETWTIPLLTFLAEVLTEVLAAVLPVTAAVQKWLVGALTTLIGWLLKGVEAIANFVRDGIDKIKAFAETSGTWLNKVVKFFTDLPGNIGKALSGAGTWLLDTGRKIIDGLIDGIRAGFDKVKDLLSNLTDLLPDWKGPAEVDARLLTDNGELIMQSLMDGLEARFGDVRSLLGNFTADLGTLDLAANIQPAGHSGVAAGLSLRVDNVTDPAKLAEHVMERVMDAVTMHDLEGVIT